MRKTQVTPHIVLKTTSMIRLLRVFQFLTESFGRKSCQVFVYI